MDINIKVTADSTAINVYMQKINLIPMLSADEEKEVAQKAHNGDEAALNKLIESNLRLVVYVATKYHPNTSQELLDLIQEGNFGLMTAAKKYNPNSGNKFSTYAYYWIRQAISNSINKNSRTVRIPAHAQVIIQNIEKTAEELEERNGCPPTRKELAEATGYSEDELNMYQSANQAMLSLDYIVDDNRDTETIDLIADQENVDPAEVLKDSEQREGLLRVLDTLKQDEKTVLMMRYGLDDGIPKTLSEVGRRTHIGRERVKKLEVKGMLKLRSPYRQEALRGIMNDY